MEKSLRVALIIGFIIILLPFIILMGIGSGSNTNKTLSISSNAKESQPIGTTLQVQVSNDPNSTASSVPGSVPLPTVAPLSAASPSPQTNCGSTDTNATSCSPIQ